MEFSLNIWWFCGMARLLKYDVTRSRKTPRWPRITHGIQNLTVAGIFPCLLLGNLPVRADEEEVKPEALNTDVVTNLTQCPDCQGKVSKRALMCPHCGCPGAAIQQAVEAAEEGVRPKSVVSVITDHATGSGIAIQEGDSTYIVIDTFLLADSMKLELHDLVTGENLPYTEVQLAANAGFMRLRVVSDKVAFTPLAPADSESVSYLDAAGLVAEKDHAVADLDAGGRISGIVLGQDHRPLHSGMKWQSVTPKPLRQQLNLLSRMKAEKERGQKPALPAQETATQWLTPYFSDLASQLTR